MPSLIVTESADPGTALPPQVVVEFQAPDTLATLAAAPAVLAVSIAIANIAKKHEVENNPLRIRITPPAFFTT